ncbi:NRDE family protein [Mycetohabitans sp. B46]|uniref:NRDE family protein n=1 Tax=Mycetohabitans sp. B46 TaxID=2772536 RepID=UPI003FD1D121
MSDRIPMFLIGAACAPSDYVKQVADCAATYHGFNLLIGDWTRRELIWLSNRDPGPPRRLGPGLYGLSNALLDSRWPKVERKKTNLRRYLDTIALVGLEHTPDSTGDLVGRAAADSMPRR